jgi:tetratricopeptide (TPR) repeat protein
MLAADPKNTRLVQDVTEKIAASGKAERAKPIIVKAVDENPGDPSLVHLKWLILQATKDYAEAAATGEQMIKSDTAAADTTFFTRQAALYALAEQPQKAAETTARGVAKFKNNATLWSLNAQTQRLAGQTQAAVDAANTAIKLDPKAQHAYLRKAQAEIDLEQPDSALAALRAGLAAGEDSATVAQFVLAMGSKAYKAAADTSHPPKIEDFQRAVSILSMADSIAPSAQAKFVLGVSAYRVGDIAVRENQSAKQCDLAKLAESSFLTAQINIAAGGSVDPQTAQALLSGMQQYTPAVESQVKKFCK